MKKFIFGLLAALSLAFALTSCEMTYGENEYPALVQYYCCWGDSVKWYDHSDVSKTLMLRDASSGIYTIDVETERKNQRFEITKGAGYSIEYMADAKGVCSADDDTLANFPKALDNGYGSKQTALPKPGKYTITFDPTTEKYSVTAK